MVDVPVLKIPVDDSEFRAFLDAFNKFRVDAAEIPQTMADIDRVVGAMPEHLRPAADVLVNAAETAGAVAEGAAASGGRTSKRRRGGVQAALRPVDWALTAIGVRRFGSSITTATRDLAKWERMTAVFSGLLGAGGLYGLNTLAAAAAQRRQESSGLGLTSGQAASFGVNYRALGDVGGVLSGLSGAETDFAKRQPLQSLGIDPAGKNSLTIFGEMLPKLKRIADEAAPGTLGATTRAYGLDRVGVTEEMMRVIRTTSAADLDRMRTRAGGDVGALEIPDDVGRKWQELVTTLHKAETEVQTALAGNLVQLTPGLEDLAKSTTHLIDRFLNSRQLKTWLHDVNDALVGFAKTVGSTSAQDTVKGFLNNFRMAKNDFDALNNWLNGHSGVITTSLAIGAAWRLGGPAAAAAAAVLVGGHYAGQAIDPLIPRLAAPKSGGRTLGDDLGLPGVDEPTPDKNSQRGSPTTYEVTPADPSKPVPALNLKGSPFAHPDVENVDPRLREILAAGQTHLPPGYTMRVNEGYNPNGHAPGSQHHIRGKGALDVVIFGPDGKPIPNQGDEGQNGPYHRLARASYGEMLARHPELNKTFAWGGGFDSGRGDVKQDLMHFDLGGERANRYPENAMSRMGPLPEQLAKHESAAKAKDPSGEDSYGKWEFDKESGMYAQWHTLPNGNKARNFDYFGRVPREMHQNHRRLVRSLLMPHPNARPKPQPAVHVTDNSGAAVVIAS